MAWGAGTSKEERRRCVLGRKAIPEQSNRERLEGKKLMFTI